MEAAKILAANQPEFEFAMGQHAAGELAVVEFESTEGISRLYALDLQLASPENAEIDERALLGKNACLTLRDGQSPVRYLHGMVARVEHWSEGQGPERNRLHVTVVPRLWALQHTRHSRIFQEMTAPEIIHQMLDEAKVEHRLSLNANYARREYCVQYRESDFAFVSRLMEEEGIFYFFEHQGDSHLMVLGDSASATSPIPGGASLPFRERTRLVAQEEHVHELATRVEVQSNAVMLRDYDFKRPGRDLSAKANAGGEDATLEVYDYPGRYVDASAGNALTKVRLEEARARAEAITGQSVSRRLRAGYTFELADHPLDAFNRKYLLVEVRQSGRQPETLVFGQAAGVPDGEGYRCEFVCLPSSVPYRPARVTPHPVIAGAQTAIVVGPSGEEIHTDEHGRIKVQFHWDREGKRDDKSSCWMRVSQAWAGPGWGALYLPRIGQEVVVDFLEGDPDRPLVIGAVYNGENPPPISLPNERTRSTLRSSSSPGGDGANELRIEDAAGAEEIYLHAQKDWNILIENDKTQEVRGNETLLVKKDRSRTIEGNQSLEVKKNDDSVIGGNQSLQVSKNRSTTVLGNHTEAVTGDQSVQVDSNQSISVTLAATETVGLGKMLTVGAAYDVTVGAAMNVLVGGLKSEQVGGAKTEMVGGKKSETVKGSRSLSVGGDLSEEIQKSRTLKVEKDLLVSVGGKHNHAVKDSYTLSAKEITLAAQDEFTLKVGSATLQVKKSGDVVIKGAKIEINASGDVVIKGSTISEN